MKKLLTIFLAALLLSGCAASTEFGPCVGISNAEQNPNFVYDISVRNVIVGVIFSETVIVPVIVILKEFQCPVGKKV